MKKIVFFDGDGTLWYPSASRRERAPFWVYRDESTKETYLKHMELTPEALSTLQALRGRGIVNVILSTHPHPPDEAIVVLKEKVAHFSVGDLFDEVHATRENMEAKGEKILEILASRGLNKADGLMVGDSYRWDYLPARNVGVDAVLLESAYRQEHADSAAITDVIQELGDILALV